MSLRRENESIRDLIHSQGYEPLEPPVQKGWKRIFVLREDVKRSPRAEFFEELLKQINTVDYSDTKQFKVKRRKHGRKIYVEKEQHLKELTEYEWHDKKLSPEQKFYFTETIHYRHNGQSYKRYIFCEPWRYVLKVIPNMITRKKVVNGLLEQRSKEIENYLETNNYQNKLSKLLHGYVRYKWWGSSKLFKYRNPFHNKPLYRILEEASLEAGRDFSL